MLNKEKWTQRIRLRLPLLIIEHNKPWQSPPLMLINKLLKVLIALKVKANGIIYFLNYQNVGVKMPILNSFVIQKSWKISKWDHFFPENRRTRTQPEVREKNRRRTPFNITPLFPFRFWLHHKVEQKGSGNSKNKKANILFQPHLEKYALWARKRKKKYCTKVKVERRVITKNWGMYANFL